MARLAVKTQRIRDLDFSDQVPVTSRITEVLRLSDAVERMREGLEVFGHYVSKDLVRQIMRSPASTGVGGERRDVTVMFTDIEGFSRISEDIAPELLTSRLSRYFEALGAAISANRGMIDKYIGDSVMAFWNAPELDPDHVVHACRAALQAAAGEPRAGRRSGAARGRPVFRTRFGLHAGPAVVGNVGARERINYTLVGAVANQASRLEGLNKVYGTDILASGEVAARTAEQFVWRPIDRIVAAGTTEVLEIFEPLGGGVDGRGRMRRSSITGWPAARPISTAGSRRRSRLQGGGGAAAGRRSVPRLHRALHRFRAHRPAGRLGRRLALRQQVIFRREPPVHPGAEASTSGTSRGSRRSRRADRCARGRRSRGRRPRRRLARASARRPARERAGNIQSCAPCTMWIGRPRTRSASAMVIIIIGWNAAAIGARWVKRAALAQAQHVAEGAAVAHAGQQLARAIEVPAFADLVDHAVDVGAVERRAPSATRSSRSRSAPAG